MRRKIGELMSSFAEIAIVEESWTLFEAILEIGVIRRLNAGGVRCPAALVIDGNRNVAGFLDFRRVLLGLEPRYGEVAETAREGGFSPERIRRELEKYGFLEGALEQICQKAGETLVKSIMTVPDESAIADAEASINEAIYRMVITGKDYLFVRRGQALTGVISLSDIMNHICETVKECRA